MGSRGVHFTEWIIGETTFVTGVDDELVIPELRVLVAQIGHDDQVDLPADQLGDDWVPPAWVFPLESATRRRGCCASLGYSTEMRRVSSRWPQWTHPYWVEDAAYRRHFNVEARAQW